MRAWIVVGLALLVGVALAWMEKRGLEQAKRATTNELRLAADLPKLGRTNGWATSSRCQACHPEQYATWHQSFHRTMTQAAEPGNVLGRFDGTTVTSGGLEYRVGRDGDTFWAEMPDPDVMMYIVQGGKKLGFGEVPRIRLPVVMTTGSHHYQTYWVASKRYNGLLQTLPLVYLLADDRWIPREDAFMRGPHDTERFVTQWNHHCIRCHSTGGNPGLDDKTGMLKSEVGELGIACEACHGRAEEHALRHRNPVERYSAVLSGKPDPTIVNPARLDHRLSSHVCGLCHGVHLLHDDQAMEFARNGPLFEPGEDLSLRRYIIQHPRTDPTAARREEFRKNREFYHERWWDDGTVLAGGREFAGISVSGCYTRGTMSCLSCHTMHGRDPDDQLKPGMRGSAACTQCHKEPKYTTRITDHTFHKAASTGSDCLNCHMPHTSYALLKGIRSHQIESPHARASARLGVPNACNLCHLDRTLAWTADQLGRWYGQPPVSLTGEQQTTSAALLWLLKGHAAQRVITSWHLGWEPALQVSGKDWLAPFQAELLADSYGVVRYVAEHRIRNLPGFETFRADFLAGTNAWRAQVTRVQADWAARTPQPSRRGEALMIGEDGRVQWDRIARLVASQDQREVTISE